MRLKTICSCCLLHVLAFRVPSLCFSLAACPHWCPPRCPFPSFAGTHLCRTVTLRNGKLPLIRLDDGNAYEGEWLNDKLHGRGIYTWASGDR